jgi:hypothetical protein
MVSNLMRCPRGGRPAPAWEDEFILWTRRFSLKLSLP